MFTMCSSLRRRPAALSALPAIALLAGACSAEQIELVNRTDIPSAIRANGDSSGPLAASSDGRFVLFSSSASNLVPGDTNHVSDLFLLDTLAQTTQRVNLGSNGQQSDAPYRSGAGISQDGRYVLFASAASNFAGVATHGVAQIYRRDRQTGITTLISVDAGGNAGTRASFAYGMSADGRYSVYATHAANLVGPAAPDDAYQVYRHDAQTGTTQLVSATANGLPGSGSSQSAEITPDGRYVLFYSSAGDLIANDNSGIDIFLRDMDSATAERVTVSMAGAPMNMPYVTLPRPEFGYCSPATLSADGRYAVFATNESAGPGSSNWRDVYRYDRVSRATTRISTTVGGVSPQQLNDCPALSADGQQVAFASRGTGEDAHLFVRNLAAATLVEVNLSTTPTLPGYPVFGSLALDADGSALLFGTAFLSDTQGFSQLFRSDNAAAPVRLTQEMPNLSLPFANDHSGDGMSTNLQERAPGLSADGRYVVFASQASNLVVGDNNGVVDVFLRDRIAGTTQRISVQANGAESTCASRHASITPDARHVVFSSCGALAAPASGGQVEVYRYDRSNAQLEVVSVNAAAQRANGSSTDPHVSADGDIVAFSSYATDLLAAGASSGGQIFARQLSTATTTLISRTSAGLPGNAYSSTPYVSADGRHIAFTSRASNLVPGDGNNDEDAFVADRLDPQVERLSAAANGSTSGGGGRAFGLSADGRKAVFSSYKDDIVTGVGGSFTRVYLRDRAAATTAVLSVPGQSQSGSDWPSLSADGENVAFVSAAPSALGPYDSVALDRVYLYEARLQRYRAVTPFLHSDEGETTKPQVSADGQSIGFYSSRGSLAEDGNGRFFDVFVASGHADGIFADGWQN